MIRRIVSTATLALAFIGEVSATNKYTLVDDYAGTNFFDMFDFYTGADPTTGFVSYTSKEVAQNANSEIGVALTKVENGQAYMGVDYVNVVTTGRPSVRIQSKETYTHGLIIADLAHMPASICGTWPAFWTVNTTNYPQYGEIGILGNIHEKTVSLQTLHTGEGCYISGNQYSTQSKDNVTTYNCDDSATSSIFGTQEGSSACSGTNSDPNSYGTTFNSNGGGVYAMQWTSDVIRMWNFGPHAIPADITAGTPDPSTWDLPAFTTEGGVCNIDGLFANHKIIFDTTFCGVYAGKIGIWQETTCYDAEKYPTCDSYVGANPEAYKESYWLINSVKCILTMNSASSTSAAIVASSTEISTTASPILSSTAQAESLLGIATSEVASVVSVVASSSLSSAACVSTGALISGQTACPVSSVEASSTTSIIASVPSVATIIPTAAPLETSSTASIIASVSPVQESSAVRIVSSASSIEQSSVAGALTTGSVPYPHTTSTIYGTNTRTDEFGSVVTETIILSTTICPITAAEGEATPSPSSANVDSTTTIQSTITSVKSAATIYSTVTLPGEVSSAINVATSEIAQTTVPAQPSSTEIAVTSGPIISSTSVLGVAVSSPIAENTSSAVVVLQTATVIPEASTTQVSEAAYAWSTVTTEGTSTVVPVGLSPSVPAYAESDSSVPTASAGANSGETTSVSSPACVPSGGALLSGQTACPETPATSTSTLSGEVTGIVSSVVIPTLTLSSAACVASGALLSGEAACPDTPAKAVSSSVATSTQPSTTSVTNTPIRSDASVILSTATVVPMQSAPAQVATSAEGISTPQSSSVVAQAGTTSPMIFTPTYATTSFITKPTSASANATSTQTITSSSVSITGTSILIDTSTLGSTETFIFAIPSVYSATGTSDASAVTAYPYLDSGVSKVSVRGCIMAAMGVMALLLVV
ncbi:hypothetical protein BPOR_0161g00170 [Botrytis porri]|uniref:GH16 domain-containing protein n=1 Tax=Botrytis porri TaxID=87229 RepID=A0A4Z1KVK8_9HELO|nr:hypothetical protein BPOR_0161g00170 [Botrytis porri]